MAYYALININDVNHIVDVSTKATVTTAFDEVSASAVTFRHWLDTENRYNIVVLDVDGEKIKKFGVVNYENTYIQPTTHYFFNKLFFKEAFKFENGEWSEGYFEFDPTLPTKKPFDPLADMPVVVEGVSAVNTASMPDSWFIDQTLPEAYTWPVKVIVPNYGDEDGMVLIKFGSGYTGTIRPLVYCYKLNEDNSYDEVPFEGTDNTVRVPRGSTLIYCFRYSAESTTYLNYFFTSLGSVTFNLRMNRVNPDKPVYIDFNEHADKDGKLIVLNQWTQDNRTVSDSEGTSILYTAKRDEWIRFTSNYTYGVVNAPVVSDKITGEVCESATYRAINYYRVYAGRQYWLDSKRGTTSSGRRGITAKITVQLYSVGVDDMRTDTILSRSPVKAQIATGSATYFPAIQAEDRALNYYSMFTAWNKVGEFQWKAYTNSAYPKINFYAREDYIKWANDGTIPEPVFILTDVPRNTSPFLMPKLDDLPNGEYFIEVMNATVSANKRLYLLPVNENGTHNKIISLRTPDLNNVNGDIGVSPVIPVKIARFNLEPYVPPIVEDDE